MPKLEQKILDIPEGRYMVISDLHGRHEDFIKVIEVWYDLEASGEADGLIFLGDLVHGRGKWKDRSPGFIDMLIEMKCNQPESNCYALLGNHELVHIYHAELWSSTYCYTEELETAIAHNRDHYISFFENMPFAIRTQGGVLLIHSGGSGYLGGVPLGPYQPDFETLSLWDHREVLEKFAKRLDLRFQRETIQQRRIPQLGQNFRYFPEGNFLWEMLMNKNERVYGKAYPDVLKHTLTFLSEGHPQGLRTVISGHIRVPEGLQIVNDKQVRISTAYGAADDSLKKYLLIDAGKTYKDSLEISSTMRPLFN